MCSGTAEEHGRLGGGVAPTNDQHRLACVRFRTIEGMVNVRQVSARDLQAIDLSALARSKDDALCAHRATNSSL